MPSTLKEHKNETRNEWSGQTSNKYFLNVLNYLSNKSIESSMDVGGCTGEVTNIFIENIDTLKKSIIIEPVKENYDFILDNVKSERVDIIVINKALFYGSESISMGISEFNVGGYSAKWNNLFESIPTTTIENLLEYGNVDLIKIDIEGSEKNIIENSTELKNIKYIEIEFHDELIKPNVWKPFIETHLPNHKIVMTDEDILDGGSCCSHALLEKL